MSFFAFHAKIPYNMSMTIERAPVRIDAATFMETYREEPIVTDKGYEIYFDALVLEGDPGTGKTVFGQALAKELGLRYYKPSQEHRDFHRESTGEVLIGDGKRPLSLDQSVDEQIARLILEKKGNIIEGHLACIIAIQVLPQSTVRVRMFTRNPDTATQRATDRDNKAIKQRTREIREENINRQAKGFPQLPELEEYSFDEMQQLYKKRMDGNRNIWAPLYLDYPDAYDRYNGAANVFVDSEEMSKSKTLEGFLWYSETTGLVKKRNRQNLPTDSQVFPSP